MSNLSLFRVGRYLLTGESKKATKKYVQIEATGWVGKDCLLHSLVPCTIHVRPNLVIRENFVPKGNVAVQESHSKTFQDILHESIMPLVADLREIRFPRSSLVAYERDARGLGFLKESTVTWVGVERALRHRGLGNLLALEAMRGRIVGLGMIEKMHIGRVAESLAPLAKDIHIYMKSGPFRDISLIHEGTVVAVRGYFKGCVVLEADGEQFYRPVEDSYYIDVQKTDDYYFRLDANFDDIQDPLDKLPSKIAIGAVPGSARSTDNFNAEPDLPKVAGNFYATPWLSNPEYYNVLREEEKDPCNAIMRGDNVEEVLSRFLKNS